MSSNREIVTAAFRSWANGTGYVASLALEMKNRTIHSPHECNSACVVRLSDITRMAARTVTDARGRRMPGKRMFCLVTDCHDHLTGD
jgi:hypothetical protein